MFGVAAAVAITATTVLSGTAQAAGATYLTGIGAEQQATYDRVVLTFSAGLPGYASSAISGLEQCASGKPIRFPNSAAYIELDIASAAHDDRGNPTYPGPRQVATNLHSLTGYAVTCDFEGKLKVGVGYKSNVRHVVTSVPTDPSRIVIDLRH
ncbi:AMIN-like domain-containing (lipo)protein [Embleya sp. AB8]|uniref:AMIN-like domain-containing (lipo)protein n=1 Tax=Embleya sp. AB8 TaxID=3156304 RepID=UPI003C70BAD2